ncbi:nucleotide-binding protein [Bradyrhizobium sp. 61]|uniref:TIR domain-containing protein n=1 Tax=Bradyrhizobium sp. 61 TaxID=2782679 RepID=UPI001FF71F05|nr:TIR domain-containing protein [Bradyrhizobium sp. 61]MCK1279500.1 nucleotide-binding protein [Bradyrhizobium sp. 61]
MARIDQALFQKIMDKLGIKRARAYQLIYKIADEHGVDNHIASLLVARDAGLGYRRHASPEDLREMRFPSGSHRERATPAAPAAPPSAARAAKPAKVKATRDNSIFIVHGRDKKLTDDMYAFLMAVGLNPIEWEHAIDRARGGANPIVGDVINNAMKKAQGVMVLLSPDEEAKLKPGFVGARDKRNHLHTLEGQPRPNVIFEAGLALGAHSDKTILVQVGDIREISDIAGKHMVHFDGSPSSRKNLVRRLQTKLKFKVDTVGDVWLTVGNFKR